MNNYGGCFSSDNPLRNNQLLHGISDFSFRNSKFVVFLTHSYLTEMPSIKLDTVPLPQKMSRPRSAAVD